MSQSSKVLHQYSVQTSFIKHNRKSCHSFKENNTTLGNLLKKHESFPLVSVNLSKMYRSEAIQYIYPGPNLRNKSFSKKPIWLSMMEVGHCTRQPSPATFQNEPLWLCWQGISVLVQNSTLISILLWKRQFCLILVSFQIQSLSWNRTSTLQTFLTASTIEQHLHTAVSFFLCLLSLCYWVPAVLFFSAYWRLKTTCLNGLLK